jgi:hypothetical protein
MQLREVHVRVVASHTGLAHEELGFLHIRRATGHDGVGVHFAGFLDQNDRPAINNIRTGSDDGLSRIPARLETPVPHYPYRQRERRNGKQGDAKYGKIPNMPGGKGGRY